MKSSDLQKNHFCFKISLGTENEPNFGRSCNLAVQLPQYFYFPTDPFT